MIAKEAAEIQYETLGEDIVETGLAKKCDRREDTTNLSRSKAPSGFRSLPTTVLHDQPPTKVECLGRNTVADNDRPFQAKALKVYHVAPSKAARP